MIKNPCYSVVSSYRGYGLSQGKPTEQGLQQDAQAALDYLRADFTVNPDNVSRLSTIVTISAYCCKLVSVSELLSYTPQDCSASKSGQLLWKVKEACGISVF